MKTMFALLRKILSNKVFLYMGSRYITYALQFVASLIIAFKLGPDLFGIWSFVLLIIDFFNIVDFGVSNSVNVLLVQDKNNAAAFNNHIMSSVILTSCICGSILLLSILISFFHLDIIAKYRVEEYIPSILFVVIVAYFNKLFASIYRVKNRLFEVAFYQSIVPVLLFVVILLFDNHFIWVLLLSYLVGYFISILFFLFRGQVSFSGSIIFKDIRLVGEKGLWLFLYNGCFYLIMYTTSFCVSYNYQVGEYGKYNYAYTLAHAIVLLIDAFGFVIFPKMIDKLKVKDADTSPTISIIRKNYMTLVYSLILLALPVFYLFSKWVPQYTDASRALYISALTLLPYANAFGINTYLIAQNKEKLLSHVSMACLLINILCSLVFAMVLHIDYDMVIFATLISYIIYTYMCTRLMFDSFGHRISFSDVWREAFPTKFFVPYIMAILCSLLSFKYDAIYLLLIPILVFAVINWDNIVSVKCTVLKITNNPALVDLN